MDYIELEVSFVVEDEVKKEIFTAELADLGFESFVEDDLLLKAYIQIDDFKQEDIEGFLEQYQDIKFVFNKIEQQNWNQEWENNYHPIIYEDKCIVKASFHKVEKKYPVEIIIDPKMSFGTGHHETTSLMIAKMFEQDFEGKTVLDIGTGTGILAILASIQGAKDVTAIDIDEWSYENSIENAQKNNIKNIDVILGDASSIPEKKFDVILANINRNILLEDIIHYSNHLETNSIILLSGIYLTDFEVINAEAEAQGLTYVSKNEKNNWITIKYKKA